MKAPSTPVIRLKLRYGVNQGEAVKALLSTGIAGGIAVHKFTSHPSRLGITIMPVFPFPPSKECLEVIRVQLQSLIDSHWHAPPSTTGRQMVIT